MTARLIVGVISFFVMMTGVALGNIAIYSMVECINRTRTVGTEVSQFWWWPGKLQQVLLEYKTLFPAGKFHMYFRVAIALLFGGLVGLAVCIMVRFG